MWMRLLTGPLGLLIAGTALGVPLGMSIVPFLLLERTDPWIGFFGSVAGGIAGGAMTLVAGFMAWGAAMREIETAQRKDAKEVDDLLNLIAAYCTGIEVACRAIEINGKKLLYPRSKVSEISMDDVRYTVLVMKNKVAAAVRGVRAEDIDGIIGKIPIPLIRPIRELIEATASFNEIEGRIADGINRALDLQSGNVTVPIPDAPKINRRIFKLRTMAEDLKVSLNRERQGI